MTSWVLVVAEDEGRQSIVRAELEDVGFEVDSVASVEAALDWLRVIRPSLIVVDGRLQGLDRLRKAAGDGEGLDIQSIPMVGVSQTVA